jgi:hypothetical protein
VQAVLAAALAVAVQVAAVHSVAMEYFIFFTRSQL